MNVGNWLTKWASLRPDKPAIIFEGESFTYRELNERINGTAHMLQGIGIGKGDRVGVLLYNTYQLAEIFFALGKIGAILVPLNTRLVSAELEYIIKDSGVGVLVFGDAFTGVLEPLRETLPVKDGHYLCLGKPPAWAKNYEDEIRQQPLSEPVVDEPAGGEDALIIMYTSGTTGRPKGAVLSHRKTLFNSLNADIYYGLTPSDIMVAPRPMFHSGGLLVELCPMIYKGGTLIMNGLSSSILVFEFAFPEIPDAALLIDQVDGGPNALLPPIPVLMIRIEEHRIGDAQLLHLFGHVGWVPFGLGFGRVDANDHDAVVREAFPPAVIGREVAFAVDAAERPEVNDGHLAFP